MSPGTTNSILSYEKEKVPVLISSLESLSGTNLEMEHATWSISQSAMKEGYVVPLDVPIST